MQASALFRVGNHPTGEVEGLENVEAPIPYGENRGSAVPRVCDFAQEDWSIKDTK